MARDFAAIAARREIELNVLDEVLDGALRSEVTLLQQAKRLGHDLTANHAVFIVRFDQTNPTNIARARENRWPFLEDFVARRAPRLLWRIRHNSAELLWPVADANDAKQAVETMYEELGRRVSGSSAAVSIGAGQIHSGLAGIQQSHQEAKQALTMGRRLKGSGGLTRFEDLGVYRLIFAAERLPELDAFYREALGELIAYDREHSGDLLRTLKAFFDARGGPKEAAGLLDVHRNTVLYRLERIKTITGLDLDDADVRLRLHLALSIHIALHAEGEDR
jgi:purine catabolism regulator